MAKKHEYSLVSLWIANTQQTIKNQVARLRMSVAFTVKHDGDAVSTDHRAIFDLKMPVSRLLEIAMKQIVIQVQNKVLRPMSAEKAKKWLRDHDPVTFEDAYPGRSTVVKREMTKEEMLKALWKEYDGDIDAITKALEDETTE